MSPVAWIMAVPQLLLVVMVVAVGLRAHRAAQDIRSTNPKTAGRIGNFAQVAVLLSVAYLLVAVNWALCQPYDYQPNYADVAACAWDMVMLVSLLVWCLVVYEMAKDKLVPAKPCRPCPWRGEGDEHVLGGLCCQKDED